MRRLLQTAVAFAMAAPAIAVAPAEVDPTTGLAIDDDWQLVRTHCAGCHSARLVTQQQGSEEQWRTVIRWMQATQNLWQFQPDVEQRIVAYLARNYPPTRQGRRPLLDPSLLPPRTGGD